MLYLLFVSAELRCRLSESLDHVGAIHAFTLSLDTRMIDSLPCPDILLSTFSSSFSCFSPVANYHAMFDSTPNLPLPLSFSHPSRWQQILNHAMYFVHWSVGWTGKEKKRNGKWRDQSSVLCRCSGKILLSVFSSAVSWLTQYLSTHNKCRYKRILLIKRSNKISNSDVSQVAIYGAGAAFRSRSVSGLKLMLAEGHVLGQVITIMKNSPT